ncbi:MAG: adenylyl-sulfate kinase [Pseudomonas sp.]
MNGVDQRSQTIATEVAGVDYKQAPVVLWFTGLSASGKSTIAEALNLLLQSTGCPTCVLDGDVLRNGLCKDLGFSDADRQENIRRVAEVASLVVSAGALVIVALISPTRAMRHHARSIIGSERFVEVFIDAPLNVVEARDPKGLYRKARSGQLRDFTGIDSPYEAPLCPELHIQTDCLTVDEATDRVVSWLCSHLKA